MMISSSIRFPANDIISFFSLAEMLWNIQTGKRDTKAFQEAIFISMPAVAQQIPKG
jgi:hypothetical protein